jgi:hypothetical protein
MGHTELETDHTTKPRRPTMCKMLHHSYSFENIMDGPNYLESSLPYLILQPLTIKSPPAVMSRLARF